jgi:hypothetical protein
LIWFPHRVVAVEKHTATRTASGLGGWFLRWYGDTVIFRFWSITYLIGAWEAKGLDSLHSLSFLNWGADNIHFGCTSFWPSGLQNQWASGRHWTAQQPTMGSGEGVNPWRSYNRQATGDLPWQWAHNSTKTPNIFKHVIRSN